MKNSTSIFLLTALLFGVVGLAQAECELAGTCTAAVNTDEPELGYWRYTLEVDWDTGLQYALSHLDLLMGYENHNCLCEQFAFGFPSPSGWSDSDPRRKTNLRDDGPCTVYYEGFFECYGDPSIPGIEEPILKFEPIEEDDCEPGPQGTLVVIFYSDWPPVAVEQPNDWLVIKYAGHSCRGEVAGELPELECIYTAVEHLNWGGVKKHY